MGSESFIYTSAIKKLRLLSKRIKVICGGSSAGKTFGILPILIDKATRTAGLEVSVVSESVPHLRRGCMKDFKKIMAATGRWIDAHWNTTLMTYTFANGSYIEFFSADDQAKVRGPRRNVLYINECNNIPYETYFQLAIRTSGEVWLDYNPVEEFWVNEEVIKDRDAEFLRLTYKDNEGLPQSIVDELEKQRDKAFYDPSLGETQLFADENVKSRYWSRWWRVYGLGYEGVLEGIIFQNWQRVEEIPPTAKLLGYGLDFGYSNDPTTLVGMWKHGDGYYFREVIYERALTNKDIAMRFREHGIQPNDLIVADSAEPKSIEELRRLGFKGMRKAKKGKDSINAGISLMLGSPMFVTSDSINFIKELRTYMWDTDKEGRHINKPVGGNDHCFVGETLITTSAGLVRIKDMEEGMEVLTGSGPRAVLRKFENGVKEVCLYKLQFDTFFISLECTEEHKIKTPKGWKKIKDLKSGDCLTVNNNSTEENTLFPTVRSISLPEASTYIGLSGFITAALFLTGIISTTLMEIGATMIFLTLLWSGLVYTSDLKVKKGLQTIRFGWLISARKALKKLRNGIGQRKEESGTGSTQKTKGSEILLTEMSLVKSAGLFSLRKTRLQDSVQINARQRQEGILELMPSTGHVLCAESYSGLIDTQESILAAIHVLGKRKAQVYDLMVEDCHEYFANGVLVSNCVDASRYISQAKMGKSGGFVVVSGKVIYSK